MYHELLEGRMVLIQIPLARCEALLDHKQTGLWWIRTVRNPLCKQVSSLQLIIERHGDKASAAFLAFRNAGHPLLMQFSLCTQLMRSMPSEGLVGTREDFMSLTKTERAVLSAGKSQLQYNRERARQQRRRAELFLGHRQRVGTLFKKQLLEHTLRTADIDQQRLTEQQRQDQKAVTKYLQAEQKTALAFGRKVSRQQKQVVTEQKRRWDRILKNMNALSSGIISQYLDTATEIVLSGAGTTSIAPGQNLVHTRVDVSGGGYLGGPMKGEIVNIDWHFLWSVAHDGLLNATSFLQLNGANWLAVNPDCNGGFAQSSLTATLGITQTDSTGQPHHDAQTSNLLNQDIQTSWGDSLGKVQFITLDETDTVGVGRAFQFPVTANLPILITVSAQLSVFVWNAQATMDFLSGDYRVNAPFVFVTVTSGGE